MLPGQLLDLVICKTIWILQRRFANERGVALPLVLLVVALLSFMGMHAALTAINEAKMIRNYEDGVRAFYLAEAGINEAIVQLQRNKDFLGNVPVETKTVMLDNRELGRYKANVADNPNTPQTTDVLISAVGQSNNIVRRIEVVANVEKKLTCADYAVFGGNDVTLGTTFSLSSLWAVVTSLIGNTVFGTNGNMYASGDVNIGPFYKIQGNVNSGGDTNLESGFGQATISDTANSHTGVDTTNYRYPRPDDAQYRAAAEKPGQGVVYENNNPALITDEETGRKTLVIDDQLQGNLSGIVYVDGDIEIASNLTKDVTLFAHNGNIKITKGTASYCKIGLVASQVDDLNAGNIDLGTLALFGNSNNPVFIYAERDISATRIGGLEDLINYSGLNGTIVGRNINLNNVKINYHQAIKTPYTTGEASAPPLPPNMGFRVRVEQSNWNDIGITAGPEL